MVEIKGQYSKFAGTFAEYSLGLDVIAAPVENTTEAVEMAEEAIVEPEVPDTSPTAGTDALVGEDILAEALQ